jgi:phosphomannomutase
MGYEEALGYTVGTVARDKDGIGSALVFADLAAWCRSRGVTVHEYLEEIRRAHGVFVAKQRNFTFPGAEGAAAIKKIMEGFRASAPAAIAGVRVATAKDYQAGVADMPRSNVIAYELEDGSRITLRPSGTEPKIKYYFDVRAEDRPRAEALLARLEEAFLVLAKERGQP